MKHYDVLLLLLDTLAILLKEQTSMFLDISEPFKLVARRSEVELYYNDLADIDVKFLEEERIGNGRKRVFEFS